MSQFWAVLILLGIATVHNHVGRVVADFYHLGVCYDRNGNDLPDPKTAVELCKKYGFKKIRVWNGDRDVLDALMDQGIAVTISIKNDDLPATADLKGGGTEAWYQNNVKPYIGRIVFEYIVVGDEAIPGPFSNVVGVAVTNLRLVLEKFAQRSIKVTTAVSISVLGVTFPPSIGVFKPEMKEPMADLLNRIRTFVLEPVLMVNLFPYDYHAQGIIPQDFATFSMDKAYITDGQKGYSNVLDGLLDAFYSAMAEENVTDVKLVVSASGWPSVGNGGYTTPTLAAKYNQKFMRRIASAQGTPARPLQPVDGFVYNLFNENLKAAGPAQHFGLFNSDTTPAYNFTVPH